jgi:hypothetical protein
MPHDSADLRSGKAARACGWGLAIYRASSFQPAEPFSLTLENTSLGGQTVCVFEEYSTKEILAWIACMLVVAGSPLWG